MSFLDRIKGSGHDKNADASPSMLAEPFDELSPPANPMEATVRLGHSTLSPPMPNAQRAETDDSSIISEAAPSELAADYADMGLSQGPDEGGAFSSGLPVIGAWPLARQQRTLLILFGAGLLGLVLTAVLAITASSRSAMQVAAAAQATTQSQRLAKSATPGLGRHPGCIP
jgi:twitching motility protein PilJ